MKPIVVVAVLGIAACKGKQQQDEPAKVVEPAPAPTPAPAPPAGGPAIALAAGESFDGADIQLTGTNPLTWTPSGGEPVALGVVFKGEKARLVAATAGGTTELATIDFNPAYSVNLGLTANPDGTALVVFQSTGGSGDPGFYEAWTVAWDQKPVIKQKGNWEDAAKVPAWAKLPAK